MPPASPLTLLTSTGRRQWRGRATSINITCLPFDGEKRVCDIEEESGISQPLAPYHLQVLRGAGLVEVRREGTWSYYRLAPWSMRQLNNGFHGVLEEHGIPAEDPEPVRFAADLEWLKSRGVTVERFNPARTPEAFAGGERRC